MLTDREIKAAAPREKAYRLADGQGLHLQVEPKGGKLWRYRYEFGGSEKMLAFGKYPAVGLADARKARAAARATLDEGKDPGVERRLAKARQVATISDTLEPLARAWLEREKPRWSQRYYESNLSLLERYAFPTLGKLPINRITPPMVLAVLRKVEARGTLDAAARLRQRLSAVFVYAIACGVGENDPAAIVAGALARPERGRRPAAGTLEAARAVLVKTEGLPAFGLTHLAHRFLALTAVRQGEMTSAQWAEMEGLDGPAPLWRIPKERMKGRKDDRHEHLVPLSRQAVEILAEARRLTGRTRFVFGHSWDPRRGMSTGTLIKLIQRAELNGEHVAHGWRSAFSTIMNERHRPDREVIDLMLAHVRGNKVEAAYNRAAYMDRRRELAQEWADLLLEGRGSAADLLADRAPISWDAMNKVSAPRAAAPAPERGTPPRDAPASRP